MTNENKTALAERIADTFLHFDPYICFDREKISSFTAEQLGSVEGCHRILEELSALIMN